MDREKSVKTGNKAPESGVYRLVDTTKYCIPTQEEREIPLSKNEKAPPVSSCGCAGTYKKIRDA